MCEIKKKQLFLKRPFPTKKIIKSLYVVILCNLIRKLVNLSDYLF